MKRQCNNRTTSASPSVISKIIDNSIDHNILLWSDLGYGSGAKPKELKSSQFNHKSHVMKSNGFPVVQTSDYILFEIPRLYPVHQYLEPRQTNARV